MGMNKQSTFIFRLACIGLIFFVSSGAIGAPEEKSDDSLDKNRTREMIIGQTVKVFAKGYIAMAGIDRAKKSSIARLEKMDDREFSIRYAALYSEMQNFPQDLKTAYGIDEKMDRATAIKKIQSAGKNDLFTIIDAIPDAFISSHFDNFLGTKSADAKKALSPRELMRFWSDVRKKIEGE